MIPTMPKLIKTLVLLVLCNAGTLVLCNTTQAAGDKPNILFIEADDLMPQFMNKLGGGFGHTPNLDRLATEGVYLASAVAQAPMCGPSRNGMLCNLYPHNLGFYRNGNLKRIPDDAWVFPPTLQQAGYQTAYVGKSHIKARKSSKNGKDKDAALREYGFDYAINTGERFAMFSSLKKGQSIDHLPYVKHLKERGKYEDFVADNSGRQGKRSSMTDDIDYLDGYTAHVAVDWITEGRDTERPFFMWFNFCLPHGPYDVPDRYFDIAEKLDIPPPRTTKFGHDVPAPLLVDNKDINEKNNVDKFVKELRVGEAANVAFMDKMIGNLIDSLEKSGELDNTVIVFFSDHSIFMGNHGRIHKGTLFEESLNASMIVRYPKRFLQDKVLTHPVEIQDLIPTAFELAGVANPNDAAKNGKSIVPLLEGEATNGRKYAFSEIIGAQAAIDGHYRYIRSEGVEILYDRKKDPDEMTNIATTTPEVTSRFRQAVDEWQKNTGPSYPPKTF